MRLCRDAKLVVLDWDELSGGLITGSLHSWEGDPALQGGRSVFPRGPRALTDPQVPFLPMHMHSHSMYLPANQRSARIGMQGRCAAVVLFNHHLALLPSTGADSLEAVVAGGSLSRASTLGGSYTLNLARLGVKEVRDAAFLHRYNEPVLLVLHEAQPTWAGLYTERKDTMCLTAFSLNLAHQKHLRLWHAAGLPSGAHTLMPVPLGGALVLCHTLLLYHSQVRILIESVHPGSKNILQHPTTDGFVAAGRIVLAGGAQQGSRRRGAALHGPEPHAGGTVCHRRPPRPQVCDQP